MGRKRSSSAVIAEAKTEIARHFDALRIFQRPQGLAIYHYIAVLEVEALKAGPDSILCFGAHRSAVESAIHAVPGIMRRCSQEPSAELRIDQALFAEAHELYRFCHKLEQVEYSLALAEKGQFQVHVSTQDPRITFAYASPESDSVDTLLRTHELADRMGLSSGRNDLAGQAAVVQSIRECLERSISILDLERIEYHYSPELTARVADLARHCTLPEVWELPPDLQVGAFSMADLRQFWAAVLAMTMTHDIAHQVASGGDYHKWPIGTIVHLRAKSEWERLLSSVSSLPAAIVSDLLSLHMFDLALSDRTPAIQPFLKVATGSFCAPSLFLIGNNFERNFVKLVQRHPRLRPFADSIKHTKEPLALSQLELLFPAPTFKVRRQVVIPRVTDADLVVYERTTGFVLVVQHKWLIGPDTINESSANDEELSRGVRQARDACAHWRAEPASLRNALELAESDPITALEGVVVSRGAEPTGFMGRTSPPIIGENAFRRLLENSGSLPSLWTALMARPDQAATATAFHDGRAILELAGYEFVIPALGK
jgi:hypothetical protein